MSQPNTWTTPTVLKDRIERLWQRGELLREAFTDDSRFPLRLALKHPDARAITEHFEAVRTWAAKLEATPQLRLQYRDVQHRVQGSQSLPVAAWIDTLDIALAWLSQKPAWKHFTDVVASTRERQPNLLPWLEQRPMQALALAPYWSQLLAVVEWLQQHPRPGIHLRQVDIPGVHSKFIEIHRAVLAELFDLALAPADIDVRFTGTRQFNARYGFADKPIRIRWRPLDPALSPLPGLSQPDLTLDADSFSHLTLPLPPRRVIITENEINFLTLPPRTGTLALFGAGYGWEALAQANWLHACQLYYWGDIDTHGLAILDQLRTHFPHVQSILMDRATLLAHRPFWGHEDKPFGHELQHLTQAERDLYDDLRDNRLGQNLRLEQEHLVYDWVCQHLPADQ